MMEYLWIVGYTDVFEESIYTHPTMKLHHFYAPDEQEAEQKKCEWFAEHPDFRLCGMHECREGFGIYGVWLPGRREKGKQTMIAYDNCLRMKEAEVQRAQSWLDRVGIVLKKVRTDQEFTVYRFLLPDHAVFGEWIDLSKNESEFHKYKIVTINDEVIVLHLDLGQYYLALQYEENPR